MNGQTMIGWFGGESGQSGLGHRKQIPDIRFPCSGFGISAEAHRSEISKGVIFGHEKSPYSQNGLRRPPSAAT